MELKIDRLTKNYKNARAVDQLTFSFREGVYGLLGVNGAGKTTLMRMLTTLMKPTSGKIFWDGEDIFEMGDRYRSLLGYLPQDFGAYPELKLGDYLMYIAALKGFTSSIARERVQDVLHHLGLWDARQKKIKALSGGMLHRAGIAQAILNDPSILILDEPTTGLDPRERIRFRNIISELARDRIVILSTHIVSDVSTIANQICLMKDGKFLACGTTEELTSSVPFNAWNCICDDAQVHNLEKGLSVVNMRSTEEGTMLRILSKDRPVSEATMDRLTLEDIFLSYMGESLGDSGYGSL